VELQQEGYVTQQELFTLSYTFFKYSPTAIFTNNIQHNNSLTSSSYMISFTLQCLLSSGLTLNSESSF
jgi:hypothetical protein